MGKYWWTKSIFLFATIIQKNSKVNLFVFSFFPYISSYKVLYTLIHWISSRRHPPTPRSTFLESWSGFFCHGESGFKKSIHHRNRSCLTVGTNQELEMCKKWLIWDDANTFLPEIESQAKTHPNAFQWKCLSDSYKHENGWKSWHLLIITAKMCQKLID